MTVQSPGDAPSTVVEFRDVSFGYGSGATIIGDISFSIHEGEVVTLLGPSGCGKSTLLNMVAGLLKPRTGVCTFGGGALSGVNTGVGYMTQDDTLLPWRTVRSNIALPLRLRGVPKAEINDRVDDYLHRLHLTHAAKLFPGQLSGGMKRRALLCRSLIYDPRMVLMDEPFAAIDADLREGLHDEVRRMVEELDQTVLFVTHDIGEAALLSDRVVVLAGSPVASIRDIVTIPFGSHRDLAAIRTDQSFFDVQTALRDALRADTEGATP